MCIYFIKAEIILEMKKHGIFDLSLFNWHELIPKTFHKLKSSHNSTSCVYIYIYMTRSMLCLLIA